MKQSVYSRIIFGRGFLLRTENLSLRKYLDPFALYLLNFGVTVQGNKTYVIEESNSHSKTISAKSYIKNKPLSSI